MKFLQDEFPKGTFKNQKSDGAYIDETLANNLDIYAKKIIDDMHFLILISGNDSVGNGKSTLATHIGCYLTSKINELHKKNNTFTSGNVALESKKLVDQSFELPKYSVVLLDEGDDLVTHGMKQAAVELKRFFRKCRQLNQILILILPSFFELPKFYALARSHCLLNVKFHGEFERGLFDFYGPKSKKKLYLKGKRDWDYQIINEDFDGNFFGNYTFYPNLVEETEKYKKKKYEDMIDDKEENQLLNQKQMQHKVAQKYFMNLHHNLPDIAVPKLANALGIGKTTAYTYINNYEKEMELRKTSSVAPGQ
jgi:hypothetical protein